MLSLQFRKSSKWGLGGGGVADWVLVTKESSTITNFFNIVISVHL